MTRNVSLSIFLWLLLSLAGCSNQTQKEYQKLTASGVSSQEAYSALVEFDESHPDFFSSKLDLAVLYLASARYPECRSYLEKAESLMKKGSRVTNEQKALLLASLAAMKLLESDIEEAWNYASSSWAVPKAGKRYGYLCGRILTAMEKKDDALKYFDECYALFPDAIDSEAARAYMYLLSLNKNYDKAREILEIYIEKGDFFPGLGLYSSGVYEKCGDFEKSIYQAFLDYEYHACFGNADDSRFLANLETLEEKYTENGIKLDEKAEAALVQLKALYGTVPSVTPASDYYVAQYVLFRQKIRSGSFDASDFRKFVSLENYFNQFPCYYWLLTKLVPRFEDPEYVQDIVAGLCEKIIMLDPSSIFVPDCRKTLGKTAGLTEKECEKLRLSEEIEDSVFRFVRTGKEEYLEEVYSFLTLPDCTYVYEGVMLLRNSIVNKKLLKEFTAKVINADGRLKDRLTFILS